MKGLLILFEALIPRVKDMNTLLGEALLELSNRLSYQHEELSDALERGNDRISILSRDLMEAQKEIGRLREELVNAKCEMASAKKTPVITEDEANSLFDVISSALNYYDQSCFYDHYSRETTEKFKNRAYEARAIVERLSETE
jgi:chromosome segregation ATPase